MTDRDQPESLFDIGERFDEAWEGMPEFVQEDRSPYKSVIVHFATKADMEQFARLVKQTMTIRTQSLWYPEAEQVSWVIHRYTDEPKISDLCSD